LINEPDADGMSPLTWASRRGDYAAVEIHRRHGADISIASHSSATALYYLGASLSLGGPALVRALLKADNLVNARTFRGETPFHIGVMYHDGPLNFIASLVSYSADMEARDYRGISILDPAIQSDHVKSVAYLLNQGVLLDRLGSDNITGLSVAIIYNSYSVLKLLTDRGADSSIVSKEQKTLPQLAAAYAGCETLSLLTGYGLDVDRDGKDLAGHTAEDVFTKRNDKGEALILRSEALFDSLGTSSIIFADVDPKGLTVMAELLQVQHEESPTSEECFDAAEAFSAQA
jgi:ankyrin repeat protein